MPFDPNITPEYAINIPGYESEVWLLAKKLGLQWESFKSIMCDETLYRRLHDLGFDSVTKSNVIEILQTRLEEYQQMTWQERKERNIKQRTLSNCIKMLSKVSHSNMV